MSSVVHLSMLDWIVVLVYLGASLCIGLALTRKSQEAEQFLLLGRGLTLPLFVGSLVATWYGGILGVGEIAYRDGMVNWLIQGGFWYVGYLIFAFALAGRLRLSRQTTLPDQFGLMHGPEARVLAIVLNFFNVVPIAYMLSMGIMVQLVTGWPLWLGILLGSLVMGLYSATGGFRAVVYTDMLQFGLMCLTVALLLGFCVIRLGGADYLTSRVPASHLSLFGRYSVQELAVWALIALSTLVDPNFYHRCYAASSPAVARRGLLLSIGFWMLFDVCTTFGGLYARAALPEVEQPLFAYPMLADRLLPSGLKGLFVVGLLATVMSTVDSYSFVGAMSFSHDLYRRVLRPEASDRAMVAATRIGLLFTLGLAMGLALCFSGSIKAVWKTMGSLSTSAVLLPMGLGLVGWRPPGAGLVSMVGGVAGTLGWAALRHLVGGPFLCLEALLPGLGLALLGYLAMGLRARLRRAPRG